MSQKMQGLLILTLLIAGALDYFSGAHSTNVVLAFGADPSTIKTGAIVGVAVAGGIKILYWIFADGHIEKADED